MIDIFKEFIERNPQKILGEKRDTTDRFGNPDIKIIGDLSQLSKIDISSYNTPSKSRGVENVSTPIADLDQRLENVSISLQKSPYSNEAVDSTQKKTKKKRIKKEYILSGDEDQPLFKGDEAFKKLNGDRFTDDFLSVWVWYHKSNNKPINKYFDRFEKEYSSSWVDLNLKNGNLSFDPELGSFVPSVIYYSGNIYDKIVRIQSESPYKDFTSDQKDLQIRKLREIVPTPLKLTGKEDERLVIDVLSKFVRETTIEYDGAESSILSAFKDYLKSLEKEELKYNMSAYKIISYYINGDRFPNNTEAYEKAEIKRLSALECVHQMSIFLAHEIRQRDRIKIETSWNRSNNGFVDINYKNIPLYFEFSKLFKEGDLEIRDAQREGVAFNSVNGTGIIAYDVGVGKGHLLSSDILTPDGYIKMRDVHIGSQVIGKNGNPTNVIGVFPLGKVQCYRVRFSDGTYTDVSDEHLWDVQTINHRSKYKDKWITVRTKDIKDDLRNYRGDRKYSIPMVDPVNFNESQLVIHPYVLGCLLGDGGLSSKTPYFSNTEVDVVSKFERLLPELVDMVSVGDDVSYRIRRSSTDIKNVVSECLSDLGLRGLKSNSKFIPDEYKFNSVENRLELLRGLCDTDGYIKQNKDPNRNESCTLIYTTVSERLCNDIVFLVESLGGTCSIKTKTPSYPYEGEIRTGQLAYNVSIRLPESIVPVSSEKQLSKFVSKSKYTPIRYIDSIEDIGFHEAQCIKVDAKDSLYVCERFIVTHNTLTSIVNIANALQSGACKRPLFVVPKQTYDKWIGEIRGIYDDDGNLIASGILPQYDIYDLYNLGGKIPSEVLTKEGNLKGLPDTCILMATYEGMSKIGFGMDEASTFMVELKEILNQGFGDESERQKALDNEKLNKQIGVGLENTVLNIDDVEIDYLTIDESHNMNKVFSNVKGEVSDSGGRDDNQYRIQGSSSARAIKAFFLSNYVQRNSKGNGNVCLLTATPFTNSPLEVYNMLALTNIGRLKTLGLRSIVDFFDNYVNQTFEKVVKGTGEIEEAAVIKGWTNKVALQKILFSYMNYKSGEDAGIKRPIKWTLPKLSENIDGVNIPLSLEDQVTTYLNPTPLQKANQKEISEWLIEQMQDSEASRKAPHLVADIKAKKNCISPYIYSGASPDSIDPTDYINSSPKLKYTMECIKSVKKWHEDDGSSLSCQVIYINGGIKYLKLVKDYLISVIGYKTSVQKSGKKHYDEVEILAGGGEFKRSDDEKEEIKTLFNQGKIKIIIGSSTIREGIDLQKKSTVLYNLWVDWNPTDYKQLEGRVWRFGNIFENVRIVTPLLVGSSDAFTYQKLEEKTARINDIFDRNDRTNILEVGEEDREAVKWALIDDLSQVAKAKVKDKVSELKKKKDLLDNDLEFIKSIEHKLRDLEKGKATIDSNIEKYWKYIKDNYEDSEDLSPIQIAKYLSRNSLKIQDIVREEGGYHWGVRNDIGTMSYKIRDVKKTEEKLIKLDSQMLEKYDTSIYEDTDPIIEKLNEGRSQLEDEIAFQNSEGNLESITIELEEERKKFNSGVESLEKTIEKFTRLNNLLGITHQKDSTPVKSKAEVIDKLPKAIEQKDAVLVEVDESSQIKEAIEALEVLLEFSEGKEKEEIQEAIEVLEILM